ncbi:YrhB domain-containing protein [Streptomyces sp. NBC_01006]|uniref:YrhB domain-containing protein n=1 Tax=Streptomyces sp. NBC_01006 TaxID=2903716 RepID=UPI00386E940A
MSPDAADEPARGWLFACRTSAALRSGDWRQAMFDGAVVVPKDRREPFLLPNSGPCCRPGPHVPGGGPSRSYVVRVKALR